METSRMRFCVPTTVTLDVSVKNNANGRPMYKLSGPATGTYAEFINIVDHLFYNRSYFLTSDVDECGRRLKDDLSDVETSYFSYYKNLTYYTVPAPMIISRTSIITGFDTDSIHSRNSATLEGNFTMLELPVYLWAIFLLTLLVLVIMSRVCLHFNLDRIKSFEDQSTKKYQRRLIRISSPSYLIRKIIQHVTQTFRGSSKASRLIGLLFTFLSFFMITSFMCIYSTSKVIVDEPLIVTNYNQLLEIETALPLFYDIVSKVSHQFKSAPIGSLKYKVWRKLQKRVKNPSNYVYNGENAKNPRQVMLDVFELIKNDKSIFIASSLIANMLKTFGCGSSPDASSGGPEFWRLIIVSDPFENEDIFGWALSRTFKEDQKFAHRVNRLLYSGILDHFFIEETDASGFASSLAGTDSHHLYQARRICSNDFKIDTGQPFKAIALNYYKTFTYVYLVTTLASSLILILEITHKNCRKRFPRKNITQSCVTCINHTSSRKLSEKHIFLPQNMSHSFYLLSQSLEMNFPFTRSYHPD